MSFSSLEMLFGRIESESDFPLWTPELLRDRRRPVRLLTPETATPASVLIALLGSDSAEQGPSVILTKRTQDLSTHAGQVSFPGGRAEPTDATAEQTAIREASEEIGLDPAAVRIWGRLPDYLTATGFRISPVIARVDAQAAAFERDQREVEEIFHVPLSFLMN
ncbi:MAG: NUDIX hydrolase, partial [Betaproteobacteria bacterium]